MIKAENVTFKYGSDGKEAVKNINLQIDEGDFIGITGHGGAGKTTLANILNGVIPQHCGGDFYGYVTVDGMDTVDTPAEKISLVLGSVFQDIESQLIMNDVYSEILFGLENFGVPHDEIDERINEALTLVGIEDLKNRETATLSGGQKQKVAIASIIALKPKYLILDEPTGELDPKSSRRIYELLKEINEKHGITVIVIEQKIMLLCEFAKKLTVMNNGEIILFGNVSDVLENSDALEEAGINVPRVVSLAKELKNRGLYSGKMPVNIETAAEIIRSITEVSYDKA